MSKAKRHPEDYCHICQGKNIVWSADNDLWNKVVDNKGLICCPICFVSLAKKKGIKPTVWRISQDGDDPLVDKLRLEISYLKDGLSKLIDDAVKVHDRGISP